MRIKKKITYTSIKTQGDDGRNLNIRIFIGYNP